MPSLLSSHGLAALNEFALSNVLLAFDYDGTLSPIAPTPERARMRATTRRLLTEVARRYPTIVISGRALDDVSRRLSRIPLWYVFGNHGLEPVRPGAPPPASTTEWVKHLQHHLPDDPGVKIEDKHHTVTVHYRHARDPGAAVAAVRRAVEHLPDVSMMGGAAAVNLLPRERGNKGDALTSAMKWFACTTAIYVGDDDTDECAFGAGAADKVLGIAVGPRDTSAARFFLQDQSEIDTMLRHLIDLREGSPVP